MVKENVAPWPGLLSAQIVPPWVCTMCLAIARPNPEPAERRAAIGQASAGATRRRFTR